MDFYTKYIPGKNQPGISLVYIWYYQVWISLPSIYQENTSYGFLYQVYTKDKPAVDFYTMYYQGYTRYGFLYQVYTKEIPGMDIFTKDKLSYISKDIPGMVFFY